MSNIKLLNEDCMVTMARYPDKYFDLAIVDPPYGIGEDGSSNHTRCKIAKAKDYKSFSGQDLSAPDVTYFNELIRVSKNQIIFGANHFIDKIPFGSPCWIVWDKDNSGDFADCELAYTSFKTAVRKVKFRWNGMLQQDMKNKETRIHPTQKPVRLYQWILDNYAKKEFKILDTHLGSGSSAIAAERFGVLEFVGTELDSHYYLECTKRFNMVTAQSTMF